MSGKKRREPAYQQTAHVRENDPATATGDLTTWGVQFAMPPTPGHCAGGGACWFNENRRSVASALASKPPTLGVPRAAPLPVRGAERRGGRLRGPSTRHPPPRSVVEYAMSKGDAEFLGQGARGRGVVPGERDVEEDDDVDDDDDDDVVAGPQVAGPQGGHDPTVPSPMVTDSAVVGGGAGRLVNDDANGAIVVLDSDEDMQDVTPVPAADVAMGNGGAVNGAAALAATGGASNGTSAQGQAGETSNLPAPASKRTPWDDTFATCSGRHVRVYRARKGTKPQLLQLYEDASAEETFFSVAWTFNANGRGDWWVIAGGKRGVLRVVNVSQQALHSSLVGHGESINDVKVHPKDSALVLTCSKDESLRLWNLRTGSTVAVFAGLRGHRGEVLYADFDQDGDRFVSCGIDNSVRVWDVKEDEKVHAAILETHEAADLGCTDVCAYTGADGQRRKVKTPIVQFPYYVTSKVHKHYVDCVMWVGTLLLSKSIQNRVLLWEPRGDRLALATPAKLFTILEEYLLHACTSWFIRFGLDTTKRYLACGNEHGTVVVYQLDVLPSKPHSIVHVANKNDKCCVRQTAFNKDGTILLAVDDQSTITQFELSW